MYMTGSAGSVSANSWDGMIANSLQRMAKEMVACAVAEAVTTNLRHNPVCFFVWRNVDHNVHQSPSSSHRFPGVSLVHKCTRVSSWSHSILHLGVTATFGHLRERVPEVHWAFLSEEKDWTSDTKNILHFFLTILRKLWGSDTQFHADDLLKWKWLNEFASYYDNTATALPQLQILLCQSLTSKTS